MPAVPLPQLRSAISASPVFSEAEKQEWLKLLPQMNDRQLHELYDLLREFGLPHMLPSRHEDPELYPPQKSSSSSSWNTKMVEQKAPSPQELEARLTRRSYAQPAPTRAKPVPTLPARKLPEQPPASPQKKFVPASPSPAPKPQPRPSKFEDLYGNFPSKGSVAERLQGLSFENLATVSSQDMRHAQSLEEFREQVMVMARKEGYFGVEQKLMSSPLYHLYLYTGQVLLHTGKKFQILQQELDERGKESLSEQEFNCIADLMREIRMGAQ